MTTPEILVKHSKHTADVLLSENVTFSDLQLSHGVVEGLKLAGFQKPSPIQLKAIPLGRCGLGSYILYYGRIYARYARKF